jgi:hypothetical protein
MGRPRGEMPAVGLVLHSRRRCSGRNGSCRTPPRCPDDDPHDPIVRDRHHRRRACTRVDSHVTVAYSAASQPADPIITALGTAVPVGRAVIDAISLVVQWGRSGSGTGSRLAPSSCATSNLTLGGSPEATPSTSGLRPACPSAHLGCLHLLAKEREHGPDQRVLQLTAGKVRRRPSGSPVARGGCHLFRNPVVDLLVSKGP